nr:ATP-binding protein [Aquimarina agarivorans]
MCVVEKALPKKTNWEDWQNRKIDRLLKQASFKQQASITNINYAAQRNLDKNMLERLATLDFIKRKENIILTPKVSCVFEESASQISLF